MSQALVNGATLTLRSRVPRERRLSHKQANGSSLSRDEHRRLKGGLTSADNRDIFAFEVRQVVVIGSMREELRRQSCQHRRYVSSVFQTGRDHDLADARRFAGCQLQFE